MVGHTVSSNEPEGYVTESQRRIPWDTLPVLLDRPTLRDVLGLKRADIDRIFDRCTVHRVTGSSKPYVIREEAAACFESSEPMPRRRPPTAR